MNAPHCYIDGCREVATLKLHTYPDRTLLCDEHRSLHEPNEWGPDEPCLRPEPCELCEDAP